MGAFLRFMGFMVAVVGFTLGVSYLLSVVGCGGKSEPAVQSGLPARLAGEWASAEDKGATAFFTAGTNRLVYGRFGKDTYDFTSGSERTITIKTSRSRGWGRDETFDLVIEIEFVSDNEFVAIYPSDVSGCSPHLKGRYRRTTPVPPKTPPPDTSPIAVAKQQVQRIEQKLKTVESLRGDAAKERDGMVGKLREWGVESAADLKRNPRALRMGENLAKIAAEIEGLDSQLATIDTELLKARSIVRRMEQEQAGISDDEMRQLSAQLRDAEARTDAPTRPITPLDVDAAVEAALKPGRTAPRDKR